MEKIQTILVAVERSASARAALEKGIALARRFDARIEVFLCDAERAFALKHEYDPHGVDRIRRSCIDDSLRYLQTLCESVDTKDVALTTEASCESPEYACISRRVLRSKPDLVVRNVGAARSTTPNSLTEKDWDLVRACPAPLLLTRGKPWGRHPKVAAAVDISATEAPELTKTILQTANYLSAGCDGELEVLYCAPASSAPDWVDSQRLELRARVADAEVPVDLLHVLSGEPAQVMPPFALNRGYDVVVLGALTHRKELSALVGTLTGQLLDTVPSDFLVVKPASYVCPVTKEPRYASAPGLTP